MGLTDPPKFERERDVLHRVREICDKALVRMGEYRDLRARAAEAAYINGMTLAEIGSELGLSGQRVEQILKAYWTYRVSFRGHLSPEAEEAFDDAGLSREDALERVKGVLAPFGDFVLSVEAARED